MGNHIPHPHIELRKLMWKKHKEGEPDFNSWLAVKITSVVGTMWCAYAFAALALISLPEAIKAGTATLVAWFAQTFLQLVLLSIIMVGQNIAAKKSDRQLEQTYRDSEELLKINEAMRELLQTNTKLTSEIHEVVRSRR